MQRAISLFVFLTFLVELMNSVLFLPAPTRAALDAGSTLRNGLVGHWTFDGADFVNIVADGSGNGNHGYVFNTATATAKTIGKLGQALALDGTNDLVNAGSGSTLDNLSAITACAWVYQRADPPDSYDMIFDKTSTGIDGWELYISAPSGGFGFQNRFNDTKDATISTNRLNVWHHLCGVWSGADGHASITLYLDGADAGSTATNSAAGTNDDAANSLGIGGGLSVGLTQNGFIDDARVYNRVLTASEIKQLYNLGAALNRPPNNLGLVGYWSFNEGTSTIATDFSGNQNHGPLTTFANPPTSASGWTQNGKRGGGLFFDGTDDEVLVPDGPSLDIAGSFTLSGWVKADTYPGASTWADVVIKFFPGNGTNYYLEIGDSDDLACGFGGQDHVTTALGLTTGRWYHVACVFNTTTDTMKFYVDGIERSSQAATNEPSTNSSSVSIGSLDGSQFLDGVLDEIRIYSRALGESEILTLYGSGAIRLAANSKNLTTGSTLRNGLVGLWTFDGGDTFWASPTAGTIIDGSGNNNTATLQNMNRGSAVGIGKLGQAMYFGPTHYTFSDDNASLDMTSEFSTTAWAKLDATTGAYDIHGKSNGSTATNYSMQIVTGELCFYFATAGGDQALCSNGAALQSGIWYHYGITYNDSANNIVLYINGVPQSEQIAVGTPETQTLVASTDVFEMGEVYPGESTNGLIDDVRLYNRTLTASEIKQIYNLGQAVVR